MPPRDWPRPRLTATALFPSGDEPHYLVIAQSLWRDGDLKIENNHTARRLPRVLRSRSRAALPDARHRRRDLFDPSGRHAVLMAPVYALGRYDGVLVVLIAMAALAAALAWRWALAS